MAISAGEIIEEHLPARDLIVSTIKIFNLIESPLSNVGKIRVCYERLSYTELSIKTRPPKQ